MKIGMVTEFYYPHPGGISEHVRCLSRELTRRGHDVVVLTGGLSGEATEPGPRVIRLGRSVPLRYNGGVSRVTLGLGLKARLQAILREERCDLLHLHNPLMPTLPLLAAETAACPIVATLHSGYPRDRWAELFRRPLQARLARASRLVPVSRAALQAVSPHFSGEFRIVPNGVDEEYFAPARAAREAPRPEGIPRRILFVGALVPRKGLPVLLEAFPGAAARAGSIELWIAGDGPGRRRAQRQMSGALASRVRFLGHCDRGRLREVLAEADLFCAPSLGRESFGMVLLEAMAAGVPVIASDIDGYREVVAHGVDGLLVPPGNARALSSALALALSDEDLCGRLRRAGEAKARALHWGRIAHRVEEVYREAAGLPAIPPAAPDPRGPLGSPEAERLFG